MEKSQWYIGTTNGAVLCVDRLVGQEFSGRLYNSYSPDPKIVSSVEEVLFALEQLFDSLNFPHPTTIGRTFQPSKRYARPTEKRERIMKDAALLSKHGDLGTFIIRVQHRQNSSWQGRLTWMEEDKTLQFRSIWEMVKLIESALDTVSQPEGQDAEPSWFEEKK